MGTSVFDRSNLRRLAEITIAVVLWLNISAWLTALHVPLPQMRLIKYAYVLFTLTLLVCLYIRLRGESFADFGLKKIERPWLQIGRGFLIFAAVLIYDIIGTSLVDPVVARLTHSSATLAAQHFAEVKGNFGLFAYLAPFAWLFGGFGEEFMFRGFVMTRLAQVFGEGRWKWVIIVLLQAIPFALGHAYQGPVGMVGIYVAAALFGAGSVIWGRNLWPVMIAHGLLDTFGFFAMYAGIVKT